MNLTQPCLLYTLFINHADLDKIQDICAEFKNKFEFRSIAPMNPATITPEKLSNPTKLFPIGTYSGHNVLLNVGVLNNKCIFSFLFSSQGLDLIDEAKDFWLEKAEIIRETAGNIRKKKFPEAYLGESLAFIGFHNEPKKPMESLKEIFGDPKHLAMEIPNGLLHELMEEGQEYHMFLALATPGKKALTLQALLRTLPSLLVYICELENLIKEFQDIRPAISSSESVLQSAVETLSALQAREESNFEITPFKQFVENFKSFDEKISKTSHFELVLNEKIKYFLENSKQVPKGGKPSLIENYQNRFLERQKVLKDLNPRLLEINKKAAQLIHYFLFEAPPSGPQIISITLLKALETGSLPDNDKLAIGEITAMLEIDQAKLLDLISMVKTVKGISSGDTHFSLAELKLSPGYKKTLIDFFSKKALFSRHNEVKDLLTKSFSLSEKELKEIFSHLLGNAEKSGNQRKSPPLTIDSEARIQEKISPREDFATLPPKKASHLNPEHSAPVDSYATMPPKKSTGSPSPSKPPSPRSYFDDHDDDKGGKSDDIPLLGVSKTTPKPPPKKEMETPVPPLKNQTAPPTQPSSRKLPPGPSSSGPSPDGYFGSGVFTITPDYFLSLAKEEMKKRHFDGAKDLLKRACMLDAQHSESRLYLGISYLLLGEHEKGLGNIEGVSDREEVKNEAAFFMGYGNVLKKDLSEADKFFKQADMSQIEIEYLADLVQAYIEQGKQGRAEQICEHVLTPEKLIQVFPPRYQEIKVLGAGGMGVVYRALDTTLNIHIALKLIRPEWAKDKELLEAMLLEAQLMAKVGKHPNVVSIYDIQRTGIPFIMMEYIKGQDLRNFLTENKKFSQTLILSFIKQTLEGLDFVHSNEPPIIHRDIKPENLMLDDKKIIHIMDLGLAELGAKNEDLPNVVGTPAYMSPEQWQGLSLDGRTDIYAVGIILFEMLTGTLPFMNAFFRKIVSESDSPKTLNEKIPEDWENFIIKCIKKNPDERFKTAKEALTALAELKPFEDSQE